MGKFSRAIYKIGFALKEHAPEIMMVGSVVAGGAAIAFAIRGTIKVSDALDEYEKTKEECDQAEELLKEGKELSTKDGISYTFESLAADRKNNVKRFVISCGKCYWKAVAFETASIVLRFGGYGIIKKRYGAAALLAAELSDNIIKYRGRVRNLIGEEKENDLYLGREVTVKEEYTGLHDTKGNEINEKVEEVTYNVSEIPPFAKFFDETNPNWDKNPEFNLLFLKRMQNRANDILRTKGILTLNEVYSLLHFDQTKLGIAVGWRWDKGDECVDFGLYDQRPYTLNGELVDEAGAKRRFVNGYENCVLLTFNCVPISDIVPDK